MGENKYLDKLGLGKVLQKFFDKINNLINSKEPPQFIRVDTKEEAIERSTEDQKNIYFVTEEVIE